MLLIFEVLTRFKSASLRLHAPMASLRHAVDQDDSEALKAEVSILADLQECIVEHHLPLMALGCGRTSLQDKFVSDAMLLEAGCAERSLLAFVEGIATGTFDLGVEFSLSRITPTPFRSLFPWFEAAREQGPDANNFVPADDEDGFDPVPLEEPCDVHLSFESMLSIPGPLHILHNATSLLLKQLPFLSQAVPRLVALSRFLTNKSSKQRLLATCFTTPVAQSFRPAIGHFHARVNEGRWGSVAFAIPEVLDLQGPLRRFWSLQAYNHGSEQQQQQRQGAEQSVEDSGVKLDYVHETLESPEFWAQLITLDRLFTVVRELFDWTESCPCHYKRRPPADMPEVKKRWLCCPLRGRRLPEIASGGFFQFLNQLCLTNAARLFLDLPQSLPEECRAACLLDFEHGRGHLTFQLTLKMSCFLEPPLLVLALAHHDPDQPDLQRDVLQRCLVSDCQHPLICKLGDAPLREEVDLFLEGEELALLDNLELFFATFQFAWGTERKVEGGHAQVNMYAGGRRNRTEATDSLALRMSEIKRMLQSQDVTAFLECVQVARNPRKLVSQLGLARHPSCSLAKSGWDPIFRKIVYHADPLSLYSQRTVKLFAARQHAPAQSRHEPLMDRVDGEADLPPELFQMQHELALRHVKRQLEMLCSDRNSRVLFSCKIPSVALKLLFEWLAPSQTQQASSTSSAGHGEAVASSSIVEASSGTHALVSAAAHEDVVFFRVVSSGLSRAKLAAPVDFATSDIGVMLLGNAGPGVEDQSYRVETSGVKLQSPVVCQSRLEAYPVVLSLSSLTSAQLRSFKAWQESTSNVEADRETGATHVLANAPAALMQIRGELPLADRSMFELVEQLCNDGWECVVARSQALQTGCINNIKAKECFPTSNGSYYSCSACKYGWPKDCVEASKCSLQVDLVDLLILSWLPCSAIWLTFSR